MNNSVHAKLIMQADEEKAKRLAYIVSCFALVDKPEPSDWYRALQMVQDAILKVFDDERFAQRLDRRMDND